MTKDNNIEEAILAIGTRRAHYNAELKRKAEERYQQLCAVTPVSKLPKWTPEKQAAYHKEWCLRNKDKLREYRRRARAKNGAFIRARAQRYNELYGKEYSAKYRRNNSEKRKVSTARYRAAHLEEERIYRKEYAKNNLDKSAARAARRRCQQLKATPPWFEAAAVDLIYKEARRLTAELGSPYHVDHIVPLKSKYVCGLHCYDNLQILPGSENISKGNRRWPDMP